jgi:hypothetical protein
MEESCRVDGVWVDSMATLAAKFPAMKRRAGAMADRSPFAGSLRFTALSWTSAPAPDATKRETAKVSHDHNHNNATSASGAKRWRKCKT